MLFEALAVLTPPALLYKWYTSASPQAAEGAEEEQTHRIDVEPIVSDAFGMSILSQIRGFIWADSIMQKGYEQHKNGMFKMPFFGQWPTIVSGEYIKELARAPESHLSFQAMLNEFMQLELLVGTGISHDAIHLPVIRALTRQLPAFYPEIADETRAAFATHFEKHGKQDKDGWISVKAFKAFSEITTQLNTRAFIGLPLCRDQKWMTAIQKGGADMSWRAVLLRMFPEQRRSDANEYIKRFSHVLEDCIALLNPVLEQRRAMREDERPNDVLTLIMSQVTEEEPDPRTIVGTYLLLEQVAQGTTSMTFVHVLYYLVAYPEYTEVLREEIRQVHGDGPISFASLGELRKLDSYLRETQRYSGFSNATMNRFAVQDYTFSNGVKIPKGELVAAVANPIHMDPNVYEDAKEFKPWRFLERTNAEGLGKDSKKYAMVTPAEDFLAWGLGKHACPGRWYAAMLVKHLVVYILLQYDIKLPDSAKGKRPPNLSIMGSSLPNLSAKVLFRRREGLDWE
ncbi:Ent-kaurene oxidase; AltName: Full=Cytochrome P450 503A1; AltName: Full=Cytochrome P450-4 [Serendipita indica DSM 11827]|nr:Ent-kaurene oxidase; AltName: Full=Cytochrome P450 503A1; AltName: Full=Cytochrome P450-4 [Serendipita indica DSM 11827]